jgi:hypothetical protein
MKIRSVADGTSQRTHARCEPAAELTRVDLVEPIAIALNLIE